MVFRPGTRCRVTLTGRYAGIRRVLVVLAALVAVQVPAVAEAKRGCQTARCAERVAAKQCSQTRVAPCIRRAILHYRLTGWQQGWMWRVSRCESGRNPYARNPSGASGLYQFMPGTWRTTPYGARSIWSARYQALAAAWMLVRGRAREWVCT